MNVVRDDLSCPQVQCPQPASSTLTINLSLFLIRIGVVKLTLKSHSCPWEGEQYFTISCYFHLFIFAFNILPRMFSDTYDTHSNNNSERQ